MPKDRELQDHERAHSGKPGAKPRHGANVTGSNVTGRHYNKMLLDEDAYREHFDNKFPRDT